MGFVHAITAPLLPVQVQYLLKYDTHSWALTHPFVVVLYYRGNLGLIKTRKESNHEQTAAIYDWPSRH